jgi:pentatricopeptide repeat protein
MQHEDVPFFGDAECMCQQIIQSGWDSDVFVETCLVDMYAKCGSIDDAQRVLNKMPSHNVVTWNTILQVMLNVGKAEGTGTISMNAAGRCEATLCYFCGDSQCMCHHWCN